MLIYKLFALSMLVLAINLADGRRNDNPVEPTSKLYKYFTDKNKNICQTIGKPKVYENYYMEIKLKCTWSSFVDAALGQDWIDKKNRKDESTEKGGDQKRQELELYDLEFDGTSRVNEKKYKKLSKGHFDQFKIKSLTMQNINLESIDEDAFDGVDFFKYLQSLDLSQNNLKRIDSHTLSNLKRLEYLNLANNKLTFGERNFENNHLLKCINISNNDLEFLSPNVFAGLSLLDEIDLSNNKIQTIEPCTFSNVQESPISRHYSPVLIYLAKNPITCDCGVFYLNRFRNYQLLNLTCARPKYYKDKTFTELSREDPEQRCNYEKMDEVCNPHKALSSRELAFIIAIAVLGSLLILITCCCCCNSISQTGKINKLDKMLKRARRNNPKNKKVYGSDLAAAEEGGKSHNDQEKLIKN